MSRSEEQIVIKNPKKKKREENYRFDIFPWIITNELIMHATIFIYISISLKARGSSRMLLVDEVFGIWENREGQGIKEFGVGVGDTNGD